jgi:oxygen-independent coproporphyrinogen-3 oxidase
VLDGSPRPLADTPFGLYFHVPFCARRCGYCAFATEAVGDEPDPLVLDRFVDHATAEIDLAAGLLAGRVPPAVSLYFGGGTPTLLGARRLSHLLEAARRAWAVAPGPEVTVESNPDTLRPADLSRLAEAGVTRMSFGLQSAATHVLATLDRTHDPAAAATMADRARREGIAHVSVDLIHGTPGETDDDWLRSLDAALATGADHVSAYALGIEPGTRLAARIRAGTLVAPDPDSAAHRYEIADEVLGAAGFAWYELSNWARTPGARCAHNLLYWRNHHWWGIGPSAHSHLAGLRWWNHRSTSAWSAALDRGALPWAGHEVVGADGRHLEAVMLGVRLREGLPTEGLPGAAVCRAVADGLAVVEGSRLVPTLRGRLLADTLTRALAGPEPRRGGQRGRAVTGDGAGARG